MNGFLNWEVAQAKAKVRALRRKSKALSSV